MERARITAIQINGQSMVVQDHCVIHIIHFITLIEPWPIGDIVPRFMNLDESSMKLIQP